MKYYSHLYTLLNNHLSSYSKSLNERTPSEIYAPMSYILDLGGKRVRPLLTLVGCDLFNQDPSKALPASLCVELFHNFSLIHDDILDNAPLRRNHPTVHEKWTTNIAILSGDAMLVKAFAVLKQADVNHILPLLDVFTQTAVEVCEGQQLDMNYEQQSLVTVDDYIHMITNKTAVLLGCSLKMGAICANASDSDANHLYEFGKHIGISFQILDDVLDAYADKDKFGKQVGGDIIANKKTYLLLKAFEKADSITTQELNRLLLLDKAHSEEKVKGVVEIFDQLQVKELALQEADKHTEEALTHLHLVNVSTEKINQLEAFAMQLLNREV